MITVKHTPAPALEHDAMMMREFKHELGYENALERAIVWNLCQHLEANGWKLDSIDNGDDGVTNVSSIKEGMELVFNLDEVAIFFRKAHRQHWVYLVMGNGEDILSDWSYSDNPDDDFKAAMDAFDPYEIQSQLVNLVAT